MARMPARLRKSDLTPAFEAAREAGYPYVDITLESPDGSLVRVRASDEPEPAEAAPARTALEEWKAHHEKT